MFVILDLPLQMDNAKRQRSFAVMDLFLNGIQKQLKDLMDPDTMKSSEIQIEGESTWMYKWESKADLIHKQLFFRFSKNWSCLQKTSGLTCKDQLVSVLILERALVSVITHCPNMTVLVINYSCQKLVLNQLSCSSSAYLGGCRFAIIFLCNVVGGICSKQISLRVGNH